MSEDPASRAATDDVSEAQIAVHWREEASIPPPSAFVAQANLTQADIFERFSLDRFPECFREFADLLDWAQPWHTTLDASRPPFWRWFVGGQINACHNCVDRHLAQHRNKTATHFVPEVCSICCATANPVQVIVADTGSGRSILGVVDSARSQGVEIESEVQARKQMLRQFGYKL